MSVNSVTKTLFKGVYIAENRQPGSQQETFQSDIGVNVNALSIVKYCLLYSTCHNSLSRTTFLKLGRSGLSHYRADWCF